MQEKVLKLGMRSNSAAAIESSSPLQRAALENKPSLVSDLIKEDADINEKFAKGWTALHIASAHNYPNVVDALLEHNADPELGLPDGSKALHIASTNGHHKVVEVLLRHGARPDAKREYDGFTPLHTAAAKARVETLRLLLDARERYGMDVEQPANDSTTILQCACQSDGLECVEMLVSAGANVDAIVDSEGRTPLMSAATRDQHQVADILLNAGADIDLVHGRLGMPAVTIAAFSGKLKVLNTLISRGANLDMMDKLGYTPLRAAIEGNQTKAAMMLLESRVKVRTVYGDHRVTVLHLAVSRGLHDVAQSVIEKDADLEAGDSDGDPPLQWAVERGDLQMCQILVRHGAQVNTKNEKTGEVLLHWAIQGGHVAVTEFLLASGADKSQVDLSRLKKSDKADEDDFDLCKALLETAPDASDQFDHEQSELPTTISHGVHIADHAPEEAESESRSTIDSTDAIPSSKPPTLPPQVAPSSASFSSATKNDECCADSSPDIPQRGEPLSSPVKSPPSRPSVGLSVVDSKQLSLDARIRYQVWDIPGQEEAWELVFPKLASALDHTGVTCDGPLCKGQSGYIQGTRFKCLWCENTDFCLDCVSSFHNNHHAGHPMIRCLLPTDFHNIKEIDNDSKRQCLEAWGETSFTIDDLSHILYGLPDMENLESQITSKCEDKIPPGELRELLPDPSPVLFPVMKPESGYFAHTRKRDIIEYRDGRPGGVDYYKIDEVGNVRVKEYHHDDDPKTTPRENDVLLHHLDSDLLTKVVMGEMKQYDYSEKRNFYEWAHQGRLVTRVIDIQPGDFDDKMRISIRVVDLEETTNYNALSYTWKETTYERAIRPGWSRENVEAARKMARILHAVYCDDASGNERYLEINCGLRDALARIRHKSEIKTYWIDQLSINQFNLEERAYQVSGLQSIFNQAREVTLWVGEEEDDTAEVFAILEKIAQAFKRRGVPPDPDQLMADSQPPLPLFESDVWISVLNLFDRPVFSRCWVIQEVVTAQRVVLHCGNFRIGWSDLAKVAQTLCHRSWLVRLPQSRLRNRYTGLISSPSDPSPRSIEYPGFNNVVMMNGLREDFHVLKRNSLQTLLYSTNLFEASDSRDMVYSVLGIQSARSKRTDPHQVEVDYEKPINEVFLNAAKVCIEESASFAICGINNGHSSKILNHLPSWVPDLTAKGVDHLTSLCRPQPANPYRAHGGVPIIAAWPYGERPDLLVTSSRKIDIIVSVSHNFLDEDLSSVVLEWTAMASRIGPYYPTGEFTPDVFCRTCVADVSGPLRHSPMPETFQVPLSRIMERYFHHHIGMEVDRGEATMDDILKNNSNAVIATLMTDIYKLDDAVKEAYQTHPTEGSSSDADTDAIPPRAHSQHSALESVVLEAVFLACKNRRFFVTENNFLGFSSRDIQPGDEVHVLGGTCVPFVLRNVRAATDEGGNESIDESGLEAIKLVEEDGMGLYKMVGDSYVHGFMQGEVAAREDHEWGGICLC